MAETFTDLRTVEQGGQTWVSLDDLRDLITNVQAGIAMRGLLSDNTQEKALAVFACQTYDGLASVLARV